MPIWSDTHKPGDYTQAFHIPYLNGPGKFLIASSPDEKDVRREGKRFNAFKASLRRYALHPTAQRATKLSARIAYEKEGKLWGAWVTTTWNSTLVAEVEKLVFNIP